jgi:hypothetical protein
MLRYRFVLDMTGPIAVATPLTESRHVAAVVKGRRPRKLPQLGDSRSTSQFAIAAGAILPRDRRQFLRKLPIARGISSGVILTTSPAIAHALSSSPAGSIRLLWARAADWGAYDPVAARLLWKPLGFQRQPYSQPRSTSPATLSRQMAGMGHPEPKSLPFSTSGLWSETVIRSVVRH